MYQFLIYGIFGIICFVWGVYLLRGKAVFISRRIDISLFFLITIAPLLNLLFIVPGFMPDSYTSSIVALLGGYFFLGFFIFIFLHGRYAVVNAKKSSVLSMIIDVLDEKNIHFILEDSSIKFTDYDNSEILVWGIGNSVEVSLKGIRKLPIYKDLVQSIKLRTKQNQEKVFPTTGLFMSILGAGMVFLFYKFYLLG